MVEENVSSQFILKNIDETRNYLLEQIEQNELMSSKYKMVCTTINSIEKFLLLASRIIACISISVFTSLLVVFIGFTSSEIGLKICAKGAGIKKKYKLIIKRKKNKQIT